MRKIITYPNPILEHPAKLVGLPLSLEIQNLIKEMFLIVDGQGIGLAAPQVGESYKICIIHLDPEIAGKKDKILDFVMINPRINFYSEVKSLMVEGCLSFPDQYYEIFRPANIIVEFETIANLDEFLRGQAPQIITKTLNASGWMSRVIQHEVDHLNGKIFTNLGGQKLSPQTASTKSIVD